MIYTKTPIDGVVVVDIEKREDDRGFFARTFCEEEFRQHGLESHIAQCSTALSVRRGTLRGMHYQREPHGEVKLVRCVRGGVYDVVVDVRPKSPHFRRWFGVELNANNRRMLYIPRGVAHGYLTLEDDTEIAYQMSTAYNPDAAIGVRWNDRAFGIEWPFEPTVMAERDRSYADFPLS